MAKRFNRMAHRSLSSGSVALYVFFNETGVITLFVMIRRSLAMSRRIRPDSGVGVGFEFVS